MKSKLFKKVPMGTESAHSMGGATTFITLFLRRKHNGLERKTYISAATMGGIVGGDASVRPREYAPLYKNEQNKRDMT